MGDTNNVCGAHYVRFTSYVRDTNNVCGAYHVCDSHFLCNADNVRDAHHLSDTNHLSVGWNCHLCDSYHRGSPQRDRCCSSCSPCASRGASPSASRSSSKARSCQNIVQERLLLRSAHE